MHVYAQMMTQIGDLDPRDVKEGGAHSPMVIQPAIWHLEASEVRPHVGIRPVDDRVHPDEARPSWICGVSEAEFGYSGRNGSVKHV